MKYYCLGIKGAGMSTLANILYDLGNEVVGYDDAKDYKFTCEGLNKRGITIYYDNEHELDKDAIVTYSVALSKEHRELVRCRENGLTIKKYNEILGELTSMFDTVCVSGTHGKTTTSSLITHILKGVEDVNYFIGDGSGYAKRDNKKFIIESDEFNRHFLTYNPKYTVITNIELEHTEIYKDIEDIKETFRRFANKTENLIVACGDNKNIRDIHFDKKVIYYGFEKDNDVYADNIIKNSDGSSFDLYKNNELLGHVFIPLFGEHMILNTIASIIICLEYGLDMNLIIDRLSTFKNAKRRFAIEEVKDNIIIDDYAHHPTEIKVTLEAARQKYPDKTLLAVFKPNTYSRTQRFYKEFQDALNIADKQYLTEIECNREKSEDYGGVTSKVIFDGLNSGEMISDSSLGTLTDYHNSVICIMSCANIEHLKENLKKELEN